MRPRNRPLRGGDARVSRLVPWIHRGEAENVPEIRDYVGEQPAALVNVESSDGRELGSAFCNLQKGVTLLARIISNNSYVPIDQSFFAARIKSALQHRLLFFASSPYYRLLNGEGDELPGVLCDRYHDVLCLHFSAAAPEFLFEETLLDALEEVVAPRGIIIRGDPSSDRTLEKLPPRAPFVARGSHAGGITEVPFADGFLFSADLLDERPWSSGRVFCDRAQWPLLARELESLKRRYSTTSPAPRVLSFFSESLGLACAAASGGHLTLVTGLGEVAQQRAEGLASGNGCGDRVEYLHLAAPVSEPEALLGSERRRAYDIVTLEPPALAPTYGLLEAGLDQYAMWVTLAASALRPGGLLLFVCRSRTVTAVLFMRSVNRGLAAAGCRAKLVYRSVAPPQDFPTNVALPKSCELQSVALRLE